MNSKPGRYESQRKRQGVLAFSLLVVFIFSGCTERNSKEERKDVQSAGDLYEIIFYLNGDDVASRNDVEIINRIRTQVVRNGMGEILGSGSGMGYMTMVFRLNKDKSLYSITEIVRQVYPEARYRIEPVETSSGGIEK